MLNQERRIFKPSLKSHSLLSNPTLKRYSFQGPQREQHIIPDHTLNHYQNLQYPDLDQKQSEYQNKPWNLILQHEKYNNHNAYGDIQNNSSVSLTRFDPILPKLLFKRFITDSQSFQPQSKSLHNQIIQQLRVKNINYPSQVEQMFKQVQQQKKIIYKKSLQNDNSTSMEEENQNHQEKQSNDSFKQTFQNYFQKGLQKIPYFPLTGTDGSIFWSFSVDKIILWRYKLQNYSNPEVFCILNFKKETAPISAVYATQIQSSIFKHQKTILIAIAFFDQLQFFSLDIQKYERQFIFSLANNNKTSQDLQKYVSKIMVKVQAKFLIQKILIQNIQNHSSSNNYLRPLIIFTDGAKDIQIVDLENLAAYKSHNQFDLFQMKERKKANKTQNQIIKLLHCRDDNNPLIHYGFVLKKQTFDEMIKPKTFLQKFRNIFSKKYKKKSQMILSIFEWNEAELKNDTLYKKFWNPQRVRKIKEITSSELQIKLKQNFFDFYRLNKNNQFIIADMSLVAKYQNSKLFYSSGAEGCNLKVSFTNGTSIFISNFRTLTFSSNVKVHPYIQKVIPVSNCQYNNYRKLLDKGKYFQTQNQVKNKFNLYNYEPIESEKQPKFSRIDPVISQSNGLTICEGKIIYEDQMQILYDFRDSSTRKRIEKINQMKNSNKKSFMIFEKSFITLVETPNISQNFLVIGYLHKKYPDLKQKIKQYANSFFNEFTQQQKINLIQAIVELLMQIESSGKGTQSKTQSKIVFNELIKEFYAKQYKFVDETTYIEEKDLNLQSSEEFYGYTVQVSKIEYQNFVQYILGPDVVAKQKQNLKNVNSSFNGKTFSFKVTQPIFEFLIELLVEHGMKQVSDKHVKTTNNVMEISNSLSKYISSSLRNSNDQKYLTNLFLGMFEIKESFMISGLSKYIVGLIQPFLDISYKDFHRFKSLINIIGQKIDELNIFLEGFIYHCSFKNNKLQIFEETILFCKSLNNSLQKISLILRLFSSLSEVQYCNPSLQSNHKQYWNEVTLKNILFKIDTKDILSKITVEDLFEENSMMLDELEEKLPELDDIKYLRFYIGWKKLNLKIIQKTEVKDQKSSKQSNTWFYIFFNNQKPTKAQKKGLLFDNQEQKIEQIISKKNQLYLSIEKALNEYSYQDFDKYFTAKCQYSDFVNILLSKIYYLQINYLELKDKYNFEDEGYQTFSDFMKASQKTENQQFDNESNPIKIFQNSKDLVFKSFLSYEQKVCGHQKYFKTYSQIKFFNEKVLFFFDKILHLYKKESEKLQKELISTIPQKQSEWNHTKVYRNHNLSHQYDSMMKQIQLTVNLLLSQGSEFIKSEMTKKWSDQPLLESFMNRVKNPVWAQQVSSQQEKAKVSLFSGIQKDWLVRGKEKEGSKIRMELIEEEQRRKMYDQNINEKISRQFKRGYGNGKEMNWMKTHNYQSEKVLKNENF